MLRKILIAVGAGALALSAAACNTVEGVGEDIQSAGRAGEDVID